MISRRRALIISRRVGGGGIASAKTFDMRVVSKTEATDHIFSAISKEEVGPISTFLQGKNIKLKNDMDEGMDLDPISDLDDLDDDEEMASIASDDDDDSGRKKKKKSGGASGSKGKEKKSTAAAMDDDDDDESGELIHRRMLSQDRPASKLQCSPTRC